MGNRTLVIGASGYLGSRLMQGSLGDVMMGTFFRHHYPNLEYVDLRDNESIISLLARLQPDLVLFAAGISDIDMCQVNSSLAFQVNAEAMSTIASFPGIKVVYYSSGYVFDGKTGNYRESASTNPINVIGQSKLYGEEVVLRANEANLVIRVGELYGSSAMKGDAFEKQGHEEEPLYAEDDYLFSPLHMDDVVAATQLLLDQHEAGIFHAAEAATFSKFEFQQLLTYYSSKQRLVTPMSLSFTKYIAPRPKNISLVSDRLSRLGWRTKSLVENLQSRFTGTSHSVETYRTWQGGLAEKVSNVDVQAILVDCIGGCLTTRSWKQLDPALESFEFYCEQLDNEEDLVKLLADQGHDLLDLPQLYNLVVERHVPNPAVWSCIREWQNRYKLALINNGIPFIFHTWVKRYGLNNIFNLTVTSSEVALRKPDPEFFIHVAKLLDVRPEQCLLIDDDKENIAGAHKCGMIGLQLHPLGRFPLIEHSIIPEHEGKVLEKFRLILARLGYPMPIDLSTSLRSIGLDSLDMIIFLCELEKVFSVKLLNKVALDILDNVQYLVGQCLEKENKDAS
ncbi:MAG: HAD-IA family hydrolase [Ktedonobacteraceae bacterium]